MTVPQTPPLGRGIDPNVPRFNQGVTGVLLLVAFLIDAAWLVPALGLVLALGAAFGVRANLWGLVYLHAVRPAFRIKPPKRLKDPAPPRFAQVLGAIFLAVATVGLYVLDGTARDIVGWGAALLVAALALLAAVTNLCVGCEIYTFVLKLRRGGPAAPRTR